MHGSVGLHFRKWLRRIVLILTSAILGTHQIAEPYCTNCKKVAPQYEDAPIVPALADIVDVVDSSGPELPISEKDLPRCASCDGLLRPGVVWFGEMPWHLDEIDGILKKTELLLVVGTSSTVSKGYGLVCMRKAR